VSSPDSSSRSSFDPGSLDAALASTLDSLDDAVNYRNWIVELCAPHLVGPVLEVGAGHGTFTESYAEFGDVTAVEPGVHASSLMVERYADDARITTIAGVVGDVAVGEPVFGSAVMINVLEHIEDDQGVLRDIYDRLEPGGRLCIWVPSYEFLYSEFDAKLGHLRRYRKRQLEADVRLAGYEVVEARHVNLPGWFSWLIFCRLLRQEPTSPTTVKIFDRWIVPAVRWIENRVRVPFGQSVFLVARKPA
jgi:SAM-dependent methyltransferase